METWFYLKVLSVYGETIVKLPPINVELLKGEQIRKHKFNSIVIILYSCGFVLYCVSWNVSQRNIPLIKICTSTETGQKWGGKNMTEAEKNEKEKGKEANKKTEWALYETVRTLPNQPWGPPSLLYNGYQLSYRE